MNPELHKQLQELMHKHGFFQFSQALVYAAENASDELDSIGQRHKSDEYIMLAHQVRELIEPDIY